MMNTISNFLWSMWEIAGQLPNEYGGVVEEDGGFLYEKMGAMIPIDSENNPYRVPRDVLTHIFRLSFPSALSSVNLVCKLWYQIASTNALWQSCRLTKLFPEAPVVDKEVWDTYIDLEKHGLTFEKRGRPYVRTKREYLEIKRMESEVEDGQGFTILTLPKGLSINKIIAFAAAPKQGNSTGFSNLSPTVIADLGDKEIEETVTVVITNRIFKRKEGKFSFLQGILFIRFFLFLPSTLCRVNLDGIKCEAPGVSAVMALAIVRFISSKPDAPIRLFGDWCTTLCMERVRGDIVVFGDFTPTGPDVNNCGDNHYIHKGVAGLRKLAALDD